MARGTPGGGSSVSPSSQPFPQEASPPQGDRLAVDAQPGRHRQVAAAVRAGQHDPCPQRKALRRPPPLNAVMVACAVDQAAATRAMAAAVHRLLDGLRPAAATHS
jgi:hypothetical protein